MTCDKTSLFCLGGKVDIMLQSRWKSYHNDKTYNFEGVDISYLDVSNRGQSVALEKCHWVEMSQ